MLAALSLILLSVLRALYCVDLAPHSCRMLTSAPKKAVTDRKEKQIDAEKNKEVKKEETGEEEMEVDVKEEMEEKMELDVKEEKEEEMEVEMEDYIEDMDTDEKDDEEDMILG